MDNFRADLLGITNKKYAPHMVGSDKEVLSNIITCRQTECKLKARISLLWWHACFFYVIIFSKCFYITLLEDEVLLRDKNIIYSSETYLITYRNDVLPFEDGKTTSKYTSFP